MASSSEAQRAYLEACDAKTRAKRTRDEARTRDIRAIAAEAKAVGFLVAYEPSFLGDKLDNSWVMKTPSGVRLHHNPKANWWAADQDLFTSGFAAGVPLKPPVGAIDDREALNLNDEQVFFLQWSGEWQNLIWDMWESRLEGIDTIEKFIDYLKQRAQIFVKSANKN